MTTPAEDSQKQFWNLVAVSQLPEDTKKALRSAFDAELLAQQRGLLDRIDTEVIGKDDPPIPREMAKQLGFSSTLWEQHTVMRNLQRTEQRKALQRIKGELGEAE